MEWQHCVVKRVSVLNIIGAILYGCIYIYKQSSQSIPILIEHFICIVKEELRFIEI
jgi:hypothetical protein